MENTIHQPLDKFFKTGFSYPRVAREFFNQYLPEPLKEKLDFETLTLENTSFISATFKSTEADVIYSAKLYDNTLAYFYCLLEHQSEVDAEMALRLLGYIVSMLQTHIKQYGLPLPLIYPLVVYTGEKEWHVSRDFFDLFGTHAELARSLLGNPFNLLDVCRMEDSEIKQHLFSGVMWYVFKNRVKQIAPFVPELFEWLNQVSQQGDQQWPKDVLEFTFRETNVEPGAWIENAQRLLHHQELGRETMTLAQYFKEEGRKAALEEAKIFAQEEAKALAQHFKEEGRQTGIELVAQNLLRSGATLEFAHKMTGLQLAWLTRIQQQLEA